MVLALASEGITRLLERFILLVGGSDPTGLNAGEGLKGAMEVLCILKAFKDCLPLMFPKFATTILKHFKPLLELQQLVVTIHIMTILHALYSSQSSEFAPKALLELLCMLTSSLSIKEKSTDGMTFMACLLHARIGNVYALNRQICVVKLPVVFNMLGEILACEHEEAIFVAMEALKGLIFTYINEILMKQGVDQIKENQEGDARKFSPTIIKKYMYHC